MSICECLVSIPIPLANGEGHHDETCTSKKDYSLRTTCEVFNPYWARVTDKGLNLLLRGDSYAAVGLLMGWRWWWWNTKHQHFTSNKSLLAIINAWILYILYRHGTLRSTGGPGGGVRPVGDGREERSRLQLGGLSPDSTALDLYYNSRPPSDHSTWRLVLYLILISY